MRKSLLLLFIGIFIFAASGLKAQLLYQNTISSGYFANVGVDSKNNPRLVFDDVNIDSTSIAGVDTLYITNLKVGISQDSTATPVKIYFYYSTVSTSQLNTFFAIPPVLIDSAQLSAYNGSGTQTTYISLGDSLHTLFKIPVATSNSLFQGYRSFFVGLGLSTNDPNNGWDLTDGSQSYNYDAFWLYNKDSAHKVTLEYFGGTPVATFDLQVFGATSATLPVKFLSFNGIVQNNQSLLTWSTASERNNKGFNVQKSTDGQTFNTIGFVAGHGTTTTNNNYTFSDDKLVSGNNYYRLQQVDLDGNTNYSSVIKLEFSKFDWSILGNPSNNAWMQLQLDKQSNVAVQIVSLGGTVIQTINKGSLGQGTYSIPLDLSRAASGMYIVRLVVNNQSFSKNIIK